DVGAKVVHRSVKEGQKGCSFLARRPWAGAGRAGGVNGDGDPALLELKQAHGRGFQNAPVPLEGNPVLLEKSGHRFAVLEIELWTAKNAAIPAASDQQFQQVPRGQGGTIGRIEVAMEGAEEQPILPVRSHLRT